MKLKLLAITATLVVAGCGTINSQIVSDDVLQKRAAFALGVDASRVTIENRDDTGLRTEFVAKVGNKRTSCYVTSTVGIVSDAICSGKGNALTDAAKGRGYL